MRVEAQITGVWGMALILFRQLLVSMSLPEIARVVLLFRIREMSRAEYRVDVESSLFRRCVGRDVEGFSLLYRVC